MSERWCCVSRGPLAPHAKGFDAELSRLGYSASAAKKHLLLMAALTACVAQQPYTLPASPYGPDFGTRYLLPPASHWALVTAVPDVRAL